MITHHDQTADTMDRLSWERRELVRLHGLTDRWLAEELLRLARAVRRQHPREFSKPYAGHASRLVWSLIPELAARLGAARFEPGERGVDQYREIGESHILRILVGSYLQEVDPLGGQGVVSGTPARAWSLLTRPVATGNPVAIALDRLAPPNATMRDWPARCLTRIWQRVPGGEGRADWDPLLLAFGPSWAEAWDLQDAADGADGIAPARRPDGGGPYAAA